MPTIAKFKEGERIWTRTSRSGRSATEIHMRTARRFESKGYFIQEINDKGKGKGSGIVIGTGDNCLCFIP